jgi:hypothetical protein
MMIPCLLELLNPSLLNKLRILNKFSVGVVSGMIPRHALKSTCGLSLRTRLSEHAIISQHQTRSISMKHMLKLDSSVVAEVTIVVGLIILTTNNLSIRVEQEEDTAIIGQAEEVIRTTIGTLRDPNNSVKGTADHRTTIKILQDMILTLLHSTHPQVCRQQGECLHRHPHHLHNHHRTIL